MRNWKSLLGALCIGLLSTAANAHHHGPGTPPSPGQGGGGNVDSTACLDANGQPMQYNNEEVIKWKASTPNEYHNRAFVNGKIAGTTLDRQTHLQLDVDLGNGSTPDDKANHIEVIYNKAFGAIPGYQVGQALVACGDYITANAQSGNYPPSPLGAIVHWVHASDNPAHHPSGFMEINGVIYGENIPHGGNQGNLFPAFADFEAAFAY